MPTFTLSPAGHNPFCASQGLNGVWTDAGETVWMAGFFGSMGELVDCVWSCPKNALTIEHFHVVAKHGDEMLWAGGNMFEIGGNYATIGRYGQGDKPLTATP